MLDVALLTKTIQRHPLTSAFDMALFLAVMVAATFLMLTYDLASAWTHLPPREQQISLEEALLLIGLAVGGVGVFVWRRVLEERQDRARRVQSLEHRNMAMNDALTSLPNRRKFLAALERATARAKAGNIAVCLLDLNDFKQINDAHGHLVGDSVLRAVGERFKAATRSGDLLARLGGDEFALIAHDVKSPQEAFDIANRFVGVLAGAIKVDGHAHVVGVSIGIAFCPQHGTTSLDILRAADVAMYQAKQQDRAHVRLFGQAAGRMSA